VKNEK
jgi:hypothetical protein